MKKLSVSVFIVFILVGAAIATTYEWPQGKRPPLSLDTAYSKAISALQKEKGDADKDYFCTGAYLYGTKQQDGKEGSWSFAFSSPKTRLRVNVRMNGEAVLTHEVPLPSPGYR